MPYDFEEFALTLTTTVPELLLKTFSVSFVKGLFFLFRYGMLKWSAQAPET